jgi:2-polyprenyl-3-methyl-5-hydroxy-6-metoxy-1,4-benzoquinol methylase
MAADEAGVPPTGPCPAPTGGQAEEALVTELYRGVLGREPDLGGLRDHSAALAAGLPLSALVRAFLGSEEYAHMQARRVRDLESAEAPRIAWQATAQQRAALWAQAGVHWAVLGEQEPYWSVLPRPEFRRATMTAAAVEAFYATGRMEVERLDAWLRRNGLVLRGDMTCTEYGCGAGRVTEWLAVRCRRVAGFDISPPHLALAQARLRARGIGTVTLHLTRAPGELSRLAAADVFLCGGVLAHNPPPLMALILEAGFGRLNAGGVAFVEVPTEVPGYSFDLEGERAAPHCLPQAVVFGIAHRHGLMPMEVGGGWFLFRKQA